MSQAMPAALVCAALQMAIVQRNPPAGLIVHPAGSVITSMIKVLRRPVERAQYASAEHQAVLKKLGFVGSMSRKGNCWVNAVIEGFLLYMKMARLWQKDYANHA